LSLVIAFSSNKIPGTSIYAQEAQHLLAFPAATGPPEFWCTNCQAVVMEQKTESELVADGQRGDHAAISELFKRHYAYCLRLARRVLHSEEDARDAVQGALLSAFRHLDSFRGNAAFKTWLSRIVVNQCFMHLREPERRFCCVDVDCRHETGAATTLTSSVPTPERFTLCGEIGAALAEAIARLPESMREVFMLHTDHGLTLQEVARTLGLTLPAVKTRLFRAHSQMRSHLRPLWSDLRIHGSASIRHAS
jgi:RNA polymerase sigma-70 factor (ECF subfamily)